MGLQQEGLTYVENQMQIVGANIKQFRSLFVQEVFTQSSVDPVEAASYDSSLAQNTEEAKKMLKEKEGIDECHFEKEPCNVIQLLHSCSEEPIQVEECKLSSEVSSSCNKENHSEEKQLQPEASDSAPPDKTDPSSFVVSPTYDDLESDSCATIIPLGMPSSNSDNLIAPCECEVLDMELSSGDTSTKSIENPQSSSDDISNLGSALMKFDESYIVVDSSEILSDSHETGRHGSYKKKFRAAITLSRLDNDKYGTWYQSPESEQSQQEGEGSESFIVTSSDNEFIDSDWEII